MIIKLHHFGYIRKIHRNFTEWYEKTARLEFEAVQQKCEILVDFAEVYKII